MPWKVEKSPLSGLLQVETPYYADARGSLAEVYHREFLKSLGVDRVFVQDNQSLSHEGVLRGLHAQGRKPQAKLVGVVFGKILDVAVDARTGSPTYGRWFSCSLSGDNHQQLFIPEGFLHGFYVVQGPAMVQYRCSEFYDPNDQVGVKWDDEQLAIEWPVKKPILSDKDSKNIAWSELKPTWDSWRYLAVS